MLWTGMTIDAVGGRSVEGAANDGWWCSVEVIVAEVRGAFVGGPIIVDAKGPIVLDHPQEELIEIHLD